MAATLRLDFGTLWLPQTWTWPSLRGLSRPSLRVYSRTWICVSVYLGSPYGRYRPLSTRGRRRLERRFALTDDGQPLGAHPITARLDTRSGGGARRCPVRAV